MAVLDDLLDNLEGDAPIHTILVGAHWTLVCSRRCGLAATLINDHPHGHATVRDAGRLHLKSARELAEYARSEILLEASIGVAALNSLLQVDESQCIDLNAYDLLAQEGRGRNVAIVGHFPFIPKLRPIVGQLWVIEQRPSQDEYPADAAVNLLPQADVVAITSSALINHTLDGLLKLCRPQALVMLLGPSTPLSPVLFAYGASILSGAWVMDQEAVIRSIAQGASLRQMEALRLVTMIKPA